MKNLQFLFLILGLTIFVNAQKSILSGTVYDANGAIIPQVIVVATNEKGEKFESTTNDEGIYNLNLPFNLYVTETMTVFSISKYKLVVEKTRGFDRFEMKDFKFVHSTSGKMILDIALDLDNSNCGVAGICENVTEVSSNIKDKVSDKILLRPLEKLPKKQNKHKRKI